MRKVQLICDPYSGWVVQTIDDFGYTQQLGYGTTMEEAIRSAAQHIGKPIAINLSPPDTADISGWITR